MVAHGTPCLGPVTHAGCGALCPSYHRGCYGCFGPMEQPNAAALGSWMAGHGMPEQRRRAAVPHVLRRRPGVPRRERGARWLSARSSPRCSPASRARARWRCASATARCRTCNCASTSRRASSRPSCAAGAFTEVPDITARICGICPVAYQMSSIAAMEDVCGVEVAPPGPGAAPPALLRRVDREPRAARVHAPRAGLPRVRQRIRDGARPRRDRRAGAARSRRRATRSCASSAGARSIRSTSASAASIARPRVPSSHRWSQELERAREFALQAVGFTASLPFPDFEEDYVFVALSDPDVYAIEGGRLRLEHRPRPRARRSTRTTSSKSTSSTPPRCTRGMRDGTRYLVGPAGPLRAQPRPALAGGPRGRRRGGP